MFRQRMFRRRPAGQRTLRWEVGAAILGVVEVAVMVEGHRNRHLLKAMKRARGVLPAICQHC